MKIGFIGQGFVGKAYADNFEGRGFDIVRYDLESFLGNKERIHGCDIVFVAVPTPTHSGSVQNIEAVRDALGCIRDFAIAVIRSTVLPNVTEELQSDFPNLYLFHVPEFLREKYAAEDVAHPERNIIGYTEKSKRKIDELVAILPPAPHVLTMTAREASLVKYAGNCYLTMKLIYFNLLHDLATKLGADPEKIREAAALDPRIGPSHTQAVSDGGRGAGGHCFVKDFAAFRALAETELLHETAELFRAAEEYNVSLLRASGKSRDEIKKIYG